MKNEQNNLSIEGRLKMHGNDIFAETLAIYKYKL